MFLSILFDFYLVTLTFGPLTTSKFITWIICCKILMPFLFSANLSITQLCHLFLCTGSCFTDWSSCSNIFPTGPGGYCCLTLPMFAHAHTCSISHPVLIICYLEITSAWFITPSQPHGLVLALAVLQMCYANPEFLFSS